MKRKIAAFDVESTGLEEDTCQLLEIAIILMDEDDMTTPVKELPSFQTLIYHDLYQGEATALAMNKSILKSLDNGNGKSEHQALNAVMDFMYAHVEDRKPHPLGFNVGQLDRNMLRLLYKKFGVYPSYPFHHQAIELGSLLMGPFGSNIPVRSIDAIRVVLGKKKHDHRAMTDCVDAIKLYRWAMAHLRGSNVIAGRPQDDIPSIGDDVSSGVPTPVSDK